MGGRRITRRLEKILVADDSRVMHGAYEMILKRYGECRILHAMNGAEALELAGRNRDAQVIILDVDMPVMDGLEFMKRYRERGHGSRAPVVLVGTEGCEAEEQRRGLKAGAAACISKPFQPGDLHAIIDEVLGIRAVQERR